MSKVKSIPLFIKARIEELEKIVQKADTSQTNKVQNSYNNFHEWQFFKFTKDILELNKQILKELQG